MIKLTGRNAYGVVEYTINREDEVAHLPLNVGQGSTAFVLESSSVYMFDEENKKWVQI